MTNDEIALKVMSALYDTQPVAQTLEERIANAIREAVSQMIEEAARGLKTAADELPPDSHYERADTVPAVAYELGRKDGLRDAASKIRALKDSLVEVPASR